MKRAAAILVATMMVFSLAACSSSEESTEEKEETKEEQEAELESEESAEAEEIVDTTEAEKGEKVEFEAEGEFPPKEGYDKYTVIEYELAGETVPVTVSADNDEKKFDLQCNFFGDDQDWEGTWDGTDVETEYDLTSFMAGDAPGIIEKAVSQNNWATID